MLITVTTLQDQIFTLEVGEELELENFKAMCEFEIGESASTMAIVWNGQLLRDDKKTLKEYGVANGDMVVIQPKMETSNAPAPAGSSAQASGSSGINIDFSRIKVPKNLKAKAGLSQGMSREDPESIRQLLLASPHELSILKERNPPLAEALLSGDAEKFRKVLEQQQKEKHEKEKEKMKLITSDPFDPRAQQLIAEEIRMKNVESNMETAIEFAPESFGQVVMLYINCKVNGHDVKAFVDSGAQMTIMSQACAERCNIMRLVDTRWAGIAKGVGTQKIIGRVHLGQIQIGKDYLQSSFSILEDQPMDMLLGLDMLKRHQCCINLHENKLIIGTTGTETSFLDESELPVHARLNAPMSPHSMHDMDDPHLAEALQRSVDEQGPSVSKLSKTQPMYPEDVISSLMSKGFSRQSVEQELQYARGNQEEALKSLQKKYPKPQ